MEGRYFFGCGVDPVAAREWAAALESKPEPVRSLAREFEEAARAVLEAEFERWSPAGSGWMEREAIEAAERKEER